MGSHTRPLGDHPLPLVVIMGVSGSGKTTIGSRVAALLNVLFVDADDLHPIANLRKMRAGRPLSDDDRWPWLGRVAERLKQAGDMGLVVACSALKRSYRDFLVKDVPSLRFVMLRVPRMELRKRMVAREGHFMPASLLDSQLQDLEPLAPAEHGIAVRGVAPPDELALHVYKLLGHSTPG